MFWPTDRDKASLEILSAAGLDEEAAIRTALTSLAAEYTPVVWGIFRGGVCSGRVPSS